MHRLFILLVTLTWIGSSWAGADTGNQKVKTPPSPVEVAPVVTGSSEPMAEFVGTVYYTRVSEVATEVEGLVRQTYFEEGDSIRAGKTMVKLSSDLLDTEIEGKKAAYEQTLTELEKAQKDLERMEILLKQASVAETVRDDYYYKKISLAQKAQVLQTDYARMLQIKAKKTIAAPFDGIVIEKRAEKGEWIASGGSVAVLAANEEVDIVVDIPEQILSHLTSGRMLDVAINGRKARARFATVVPKGDIATRTFAVKLRMKNRINLIEGMEARAFLPVGQKTEGLLVPRDAVLQKFGRHVVFTISEETAQMLPVSITGHNAHMTGISAKGLKSGMWVIVKGNERMRNGQPVRILNR